jgi:pimeloyl-ACP methyl ester carboxylesterase
MKTIEIDGNPISFGDVGSGPAVLLLAGWNEDHRMFKGVVPALARHYRVLTLDWRGHGENRRHNGDFTIHDLAGDIVSFLDAIEVERVFTVSCAHGGWPNIEAAQRLGSARVPKIVLVSWRLIEPGQQLLDWSAGWQDPLSWEATRESFFEYAVGDSDNTDVINHVRNEMATFGAEYWHRTGREFAASYRRWPSVAARLEALDEPRPIAHIYTLPHDTDYVRANLDFASSHPWFVPYRLPGETHFPVLESPAAVSRIIHEFLSDIDLSGG